MSRREELLARKDALVAAVQADVAASPMSENDRKPFLLGLNFVELLVDVMIDIAHPTSAHVTDAMRGHPDPTPSPISELAEGFRSQSPTV